MRSKRKIYLVISIVLGLILYTIGLLYLFPYSLKDNILKQIINLKSFWVVPGWLILYLIIFIFAMLIYSLFLIARRIEFSRVESELAAILDESKKPSKNQIDPELYPIILLLYQRIKELEGEIQSLTITPNLVENETKEQILENERKRIARELHDSVSQDLFAGMMMTSALEKQIKNNKVDLSQVGSKLNVVSTAISEAQNEMRALLLHLRPLALEDKTLRQGIIHLINDLETKVKARIYFDVDEINLNRNIEDNIFRIIQEIISNILRHAKADQISIYLKQNQYNVILRVEDNGVGFDISKKNNRSYGLKNLQERAASIGGIFKMVSLKDQGTSITVKIPIIKREKE
ncbi:sensor histidine kinase [Xylocopilactobacillus apis]|uniref:Sensor histidine kinase n=1 Tax=Xylocopilactobacillus apis TaxID=2932183 RepID=A0AAU9CYF3_9LACO|nr:sensor histidine kinase [Xylocopilactobacillus apis]BDR56424.1 sensor histidine kinase [Xylocopilactobacillus apis]